VSRDRSSGVKNPYVRFQRLERPPLTPASTTLWDYPSQNYGKGAQGDQHYRGATPSHVIWQVLGRFTKEGDLVVDPFCGSGTTLDVCRDLGRRGVGFDVRPVRDDILAGDARALPLDDQSVDHAFLDPPYADNLHYSDDERCIGKLAADGSYQHAMALVFDELRRVVRPGGVIAVFVQDVQKADRFFALGFELFALLRERFTPVDHVIVARRGKQVAGARAVRNGAFGHSLQRGFSHLLLFRHGERAIESAAPKTTGHSPRGRGRRRH